MSTPDEPAPESGGDVESLGDAAPGILDSVLAFLGGGLAGRWLTLRHRTKSQRRASLVEDIRAAQVSLMALRAVYQRKNQDGSAVTDDEVAEAENHFTTAYYRVECETVHDAAQAYVDVGRLFAAGDPETGLGDEEAAMHRANKALSKELGRRR